MEPGATPARHWRITGVFTDIDDTLTTNGAITPDALTALALLKSAGLDVIAITGRPVGQCEALARSWRVDAIVAENGGVGLLSSKKGRFRTSFGHSLLSKPYQQDKAAGLRNSARIQRVAAIMQGAGMKASASSIHINGWRSAPAALATTAYGGFRQREAAGRTIQRRSRASMDCHAPLAMT